MSRVGLSLLYNPLQGLCPGAVVWHFFIFFQKKEQPHLEDPEPLPSQPIVANPARM